MLEYRGLVLQDPRTRAYRAGNALTGVVPAESCSEDSAAEALVGARR